MFFKEKVDLTNFDVEKIDISELEKINNSLPKNGIMDLNIAEIGLVITLNAQNFCQDKIVLLDRHIGLLEVEKDKAWSKAALDKAKGDSLKTIKLREWYAQTDDSYIEVLNKLTLAKACKKWFENKASYYSSWHYAFKTFLKRDYDIERNSSISYNIGDKDSGMSYPKKSKSSKETDTEFGGDYDWDNSE